MKRHKSIRSFCFIDGHQRSNSVTELFLIYVAHANQPSVTPQSSRNYFTRISCFMCLPKDSRI